MVIEVEEVLKLSEEGDGWKYTVVVLKDGRTYMRCSFVRAKMKDLFKRLETVGVK